MIFPFVNLLIPLYHHELDALALNRSLSFDDLLKFIFAADNVVYDYDYDHFSDDVNPS